MTDGVSRRRVSHLCSLVRLGTRSREGINSLGISINFVPRLVCRPTTVVRRRKRKRNSADICVEEAYSPSLPPSPLPAVRDPFTNKSKRGSAPRSPPPSPVVITGGVRGRLDLRRCTNSANLRPTIGWKNGGEWIPYQRRRAIKRDD